MSIIRPVIRSRNLDHYVCINKYSITHFFKKNINKYKKHGFNNTSFDTVLVLEFRKNPNKRDMKTV